MQDKILTVRQQINHLKLAKIRYWGKTLTNQSLINEEIRITLNSGNVCYHSVHNLLSSRLLYRNVKIKICKNIIFL
jgi:hypothetical protein